MGAEGEAAGDVLTGAVIGGTVEHATNAAGKQTAGATEGTCLNCGAQVTGAYCSACGQRLHLHRTLTSIGHDILHGVFHFEGKLWRTLPELFLRPGQLTRRYIDGERAKFISPMALYLFTVFVMGPAQDAVVRVGYSDAVDETLRVQAARWHMLDWASWALTLSVGIVLVTSLAVRVPDATATSDAV